MLPAAAGRRVDEFRAVQCRVGRQCLDRGRPNPLCPGFRSHPARRHQAPGSGGPASPRPRRSWSPRSGLPAVRPCHQRRRSTRIGKYSSITPLARRDPQGGRRQCGSHHRTARGVAGRPGPPASAAPAAAFGRRGRRRCGQTGTAEPPRPPGTELQIAVVADSAAPDRVDDAGGRRVRPVVAGWLGPPRE